MFIPNSKFKKEYNRLFKGDPLSANMFLLFCEMADGKGQFKTTDAEIESLLLARFNDINEHAFRNKKWNKVT